MRPKPFMRLSARELFRFHAGFSLSPFRRSARRLQRSWLVFTTASTTQPIQDCCGTFQITTRSGNKNKTRTRSPNGLFKPASQSDQNAKLEKESESSPKWGRWLHKAYSISSHRLPAKKFCSD